MYIRVETAGSGHPGYPGQPGHVFSGSSKSDLVYKTSGFCIESRALIMTSGPDKIMN